ncbi:carboxylesterase family protein [Streptomyces sp. NPDC001508]|uniref:carboxylesterase/lipase family protein n=1 Tax=Streptomyces sp. NPDC001508 TaxID=3154656 RepID=UPI0033177867
MMRRRFSHFIGATVMTLVMTGVGVASAAGASAPAALLVQTDQGAVRGVTREGVDDFLGIPFAAPPVGDLRFKPPQPAHAWSGVREADQYGSRCPQQANPTGPKSDTEDCLFVNVQRPAGTRPAQRLPVHVYIHQGGFVRDAASNYNMDTIVRANNTIGVTINYRLGVFGFLGLPGLTAQQGESGNYGFQDQQAALRWVQSNIAAFGGDPAQVTIGGNSAGGWSACGHLVAPHSHGLFSQAMIQSGGCSSRTQAQAETTGRAFAVKAGCTNPATMVTCLRGLPAARLVEASSSSGFTAHLVSGTPTLPEDLRQAIHEGNFARVPVVIGTTHDEFRSRPSGLIGWTRQRYENWVRTAFGSNGPAVSAHYPWPASADQFTAAYLVEAIFTDSDAYSGGFADPGEWYNGSGFSGCDNRRLTKDFSRHTRTYAYEWSPDAVSPGPVYVPGFANGAAHLSDLAYLWPSFTTDGVAVASRFDPADWSLSRKVVRYWGAFVKKGQPNVPRQMNWPPYTATSGHRLLLQTAQSMVIDDAAYVAEHQCTLWDGLPGISVSWPK